MSKASEYAALCAAKANAEPKPFNWRDGSQEHQSITFYVDDDGSCGVLAGDRISAEGALALARWLIDTFGDPS